MFVRDRMTPNPITVTPDTPFQDALRLMREHRFRRLPVVNEQGELVGIVSERDLLYASPSPATSLSVWELNYLLSKLKIEEIMTREVITARPTDSILDVVRKLEHYEISAMPVVDEQRVVGVISGDVLARRTLYRLLQAQE